MGVRQGSNGTKRMRSRPRTAAFLVLAAGLVGSIGTAGATAQPASTPKTTFQCQKKFKPGKARIRCIKQVKSRKPGSSCAHPVYSSQTLGGPAGDTKDFRVKFKVLGEPNLGSSEPETEEVEVTIYNPHVVICSAIATDLGYNYDTHRYEASRRHVFHLTIGSHGGLSSSITVPANANVVAQVFARISDTNPTPATVQMVSIPQVYLRRRSHPPQPQGGNL